MIICVGGSPVVWLISITNLICCVTGSPGCGKTLLLKSLAANGQPGSVKKYTASVPTTGQPCSYLLEVVERLSLQVPTLSTSRR